MFKFITSQLQYRSTVIMLFRLLEKYKSLSGISCIDDIDFKKLAKRILTKEYAAMPDYIDTEKIPKHLLHELTIIIYCIGNIVITVANNSSHPAQKELLIMYMSIFDEAMQAVLSPIAEERFKLTKFDYLIIETVSQRLELL